MNDQLIGWLIDWLIDWLLLLLLLLLLLFIRVFLKCHAVKKTSRALMIDWLIDWWNCISATLSQATCLLAVGDFVYVATTFGCLVVIDSNSLAVTAVCQSYVHSNAHIAAIFPINTDQSQLTDMSHDQSKVKRSCPQLATIGRGYTDLVQRTVPQYNSTVTDSYVLLVWSDSEWTSHWQQLLNIWD